MAVVLRPGWVVDNPSNSSDIIRATLPVRLLPSPGAGIAGAPNQPVLIKSNISNGNYDVYSPRLIGDQLIFSRNASNGRITIHNQDLFNARFNQSSTQGKDQLQKLESNIRLATYDTAQLNTGTDPVRNQNFESIRQTPVYKPLSNSSKPGERAPGATPQTPQQTPSASDSEEKSEEQSSTEDNLTQENKDSLNKGIETKATRTEYGNLRYPEKLNIGKLKQDIVKFTMKSYGSKSLPGQNLKFGERSFGSIGGSVVMAIQPRISDSNNVTWSGSNMDAISMGLANASLNFIENGFQGTKETIGQLQNVIESEKGFLETALKIKAAQEAASTQNLLSRLTGAVLNPNLELLFEGPALRTFSYTFELSPRSKTESEMVRKIIRFFKQGMAVQRSQSELFLKAPNVFEIQYLYNGEDGKNHPYINKIKGPCALTNCSVDYTPTGSYMTFEEDGGMVSYNLSLTFEELEPIYADDYDNNDSEIGY